MTCVVGWVGKETITIGADSRSTNERHSIRARADEKVFSNGDMIFGFAGSFRVGQLLRHALKIPKVSTKTEPDAWMATVFIDKLREVLLDGGSMQDDNGRHEFGAQVLVGFRGRLYTIEQDFQVGRSTLNFEAVGSGADTALGAMWALRNSNMDPEDLLSDALEAAEQFDGTVGRPFRFLSKKFSRAS